jgi:hypothetical protein
MEPTLNLLYFVRDENEAVSPTSNLSKRVVDTIRIEESIALRDKKPLSRSSQIVEEAPETRLKQEQFDDSTAEGSLPKTIGI